MFGQNSPAANKREKKIVLDILARTTKSGKTYAEAMIDGSITEEELRGINSTQTFPSTRYNNQILPEDQYSSMEAMQDFVAKIGPHLSDAALYRITHLYAKIETADNSNTQAYRNSTLSKYFMKYETERHKQKTGQTFPDVFLSHMQVYVLPLCEHLQKDWGHPANSSKTIADFSLGVKSDGVYQAIIKFPGLDAVKLDTLPADAASTAEFLRSLKAGRISPPIMLASPPVAKNSAPAPKDTYVISRPAVFRQRTAEFAALFAAAAGKAESKLRKELWNLNDKSASHNEMYQFNGRKIAELSGELATLSTPNIDQNDQSVRQKLEKINTELAHYKAANANIMQAEKLVRENIERVSLMLDNILRKMKNEGIANNQAAPAAANTRSKS